MLKYPKIIWQISEHGIRIDIDRRRYLRSIISIIEPKSQ